METTVMNELQLEKDTIRKVSWRLVPFLMALFWVEVDVIG